MAQPLRIALDATPLCTLTGGVRRYTWELSCALARRHPRDSYHLVSDQPFQAPRGFPNLQGERSGASRRWWTIGLARELRRLDIELFHGTDFSVPYLPLRPSVMTVHDCSPWREDSRAGASARVRRRTPILLRFRVATMIITPSEAIRREVIRRFSVAPNRVVAVPLAAAPHFRPLEAAPRERPYFLYVGDLGPRKNVPLIEAAARESGVDLVAPARDGYVRDDQLPALYAGAVAVLYPSRYEGFGLPVLEAMQCGAPVIASRDPAITELGAGAILQADAHDVTAWVAAMRSVLDRGRREELRAKGLERAAEFSWDRTAALTREVYDEARRLF